MSSRFLGVLGCYGALLLLAAGRATAASAPGAAVFDYQNSFLMMTPAQLYRLDTTVLSADASRDVSATRSTNTTIKLGRKASPSLYAALTADHSSAGRRSSLGGDGAFKILDQLVFGVGLHLGQDHGFDDKHREAMRTAQFSEAVLMKGEAYEAGVAFWQLRLKEGRGTHTQLLRTTLAHGRWLPLPELGLGLQARLAPRLVNPFDLSEPAALHERWVYAATAEYGFGDWKGELLYSQAPQHGAAMLYYRIAPAWSANLRLEGDFGHVTELNRVTSSAWYSEMSGPSAPRALGVGCSYTL